jgi:hypothetical protein
MVFSDILFGRIYEQFSNDPLAQGTFLECLEPYMLQDKLSSVTPNVMHDFVDHYTAHAMLTNLEQCIVHMDIASLDIHQVSGWELILDLVWDSMLNVDSHYCDTDTNLSIYPYYQYTV